MLQASYLVDPYQYIRSLDWSTANTANATADLYKAAKLYGWTAADMGAKLGFSASDMIAHFAKYGFTWHDPVAPGGLNTSSLSPSSLLSNPLVLVGGGLIAWKLLRRHL